MIRYTIDSTLTLRESPVFKNGLRGSAVYDRLNSSKDGLHLSNLSKRKIKQYVSGYFLENDKLGKNVSWVTLTVPPRIDGFSYQEWCDDPRIIRQLSKFLENLRKNHGLKNYIWVAERQDGKRNDYKHCTGAIHFHCIFDFENFVDYRNLNLYWIKLMNELGYKAFSSTALLKQMKEGYFSIEKTYQRYKKSLFSHIAEKSIYRPDFHKYIKSICDKELNHCLEVLKTQNYRDALRVFDPMTVNPEHPFCKIAYQPYEGKKIEILDFSMLQSYLTKYVTKNETKIHGRVWGASRGFSSVNYEIRITPDQARQLKEVEEMIICQKENKFDVGNNQFTTLSTKLNYKTFCKTDVYELLMDSIFAQRVKKELPELPKFENILDCFDFLETVYSKIESDSIEKELQYANSETRMEQICYPVSSMPINYDFYEQTERAIYEPVRIIPRYKKKRKIEIGKNDLELFDFIDRDKKQLK